MSSEWQRVQNGIGGEGGGEHMWAPWRMLWMPEASLETKVLSTLL